MVRKKTLHQALAVLCLLVSNVLNKVMNQSWWVADSFLDSQGKFCPLRNRTIHGRFHKSPRFFVMRRGTSWRFWLRRETHYAALLIVSWCFVLQRTCTCTSWHFFVRILWSWWMWVREHKDLREVGTKLILQTQHFRRSGTQITHSRCPWLLSHHWLLHTACSLGSTRQSSLNHYGVQTGGWAGESF